MQVSPLTMLAQVGAVRWGEERRCVSGCSDPARQLNWPATPGGEAGGWGGERGAETTPARCDPSTPRWGEGWCWAGPRSILPWPPGRGWGRSKGESDRSPRMLAGYWPQMLAGYWPRMLAGYS